jgi:hypothetical protein
MIAGFDGVTLTSGAAAAATERRAKSRRLSMARLYECAAMTNRETVHAETRRGGEKKLRDLRGSA